MVKKVLKSIEKEKKEATIAVRKAKKEIREAEVATEKAQNEVLDVAKLSRGEKRRKITGALRDLEKANLLAGESCESTEEAEFKLK
jgi:hypothetical protein